MSILPIVLWAVNHLGSRAEQVDQHDAQQGPVGQPLSVEGQRKEVWIRRVLPDEIRDESGSHRRELPPQDTQTIAVKGFRIRASDLDRHLDFQRLDEHRERPILQDREQVGKDDATGEQAAGDLGHAPDSAVVPEDVAWIRAGFEDEVSCEGDPHNHEDPEANHTCPASPTVPQALCARCPIGIPQVVLIHLVRHHGDCQQVNGSRQGLEALVDVPVLQGLRSKGHQQLHARSGERRCPTRYHQIVQ
mmetsp:Transcript_10551/g.37044  ORF Transcript_10551/g.37044 Transcript_10551/m.37044 type:complete len:247 (-) Transcript_10551:818-1558(-)